MTFSGSALARVGALLATAMLMAACQPAAPSPTPATQAPKPADSKPAAAASPAAPAASPAAKPAASPAASPAAAAKPSAPAAAPARQFNTEAVANFYRGKTITILVGSSPGGGYDAYARLLARVYSKHIPGNPNVIVSNMPGAGGGIMANHLFTTAEKDGTQLGMLVRGQPAEELIGGEGVRYKSREYQWIGSMNAEVSVCVSRSTSPVKTFQDLYTTPLKIGGTGPGADTDFFPLFLNSLFGTKFDIASGYPGGNDILLAMERGEIQGRCGWSWSSVKTQRPQWVQGDPPYVHTLVQLSLNKHPDLPNVPLIVDLATTDEQRQVSRVVFSRQTMGRPIAAPPGVPADRIAALREAFDKAMVDPELIAEADRSRSEVDLVRGEEVQALVEEVMSTPPPLVERMKKIIEDASR